MKNKLTKELILNGYTLRDFDYYPEKVCDICKGSNYNLNSYQIECFINNKWAWFRTLSEAKEASEKVREVLELE